MKKALAILLGITTVFLSACGAAAPAAEPTATPVPTPEATATPEPTPSPEPTPATTGAAVCVLKAPAVLAMLAQNTEVTVEEAQSEYYLVSCDAGRGFVEKRLLVPADAEAYESWTGYARSGAELREDYHLCGEVLHGFSLNETFTVLADLGGCYLVDFNGTQGYVASSSVSEQYIVIYYGGGGGSGGNSGGGGGADGGDITLGYTVVPHPIAVSLADADEPELQPGSKAKVAALQAELIAAWFELKDEVRVVSEEDGICTVYFDGTLAQMERRFLIPDGETAPEVWDGYAKSKAVLFDNYYLADNDASGTLPLNTVVHVLADLGSCLFVNTETGLFGYMSPDFVSESYIQYYSGGGGSSGGSGGGGEWTEPVL